MIKHLFIFFYCIIILFNTINVFAFTNQTISGFVKDAANSETLIAVNIFIKESMLGAITNKGGYYIINNVPIGRFTVVFSYIGYDRNEVIVNITNNKQSIINVSLQPKVIEIQKIIVVSERISKDNDVKTSSIRLNARTLKNTPQMAEPDLMRTLQMLPGVLTLSEFSSGLYVRGGTPDQNLILLDGTEVYNVNHLFGIFSTFDIDAVKDVELIKGGFPAEYGGRLSSVLDITNRNGNQKEFEGKAAIGLISAKTTLQGPIGKGAWFFSGRRTYIDYIINAAEKKAHGKAKDELNLIPDYYFYDAHFKLYQDLSHKDKLAFTFYKGQDVLNFSYDPFAFIFQWGNNAVTGKWTHIFNKKLYTNFYATISNYKVLIDRDDVFITGRIENIVRDITFKINTEYFITNSHIAKVGFEYKNIDSDFLQRFNKQEYLFNGGGTHLSTYVQHNWDVTPLLKLQYGCRLNTYVPDIFINTFNQARYQGNSRTNIEPRVSFRYRLSDNVTLKGSYGRYFQYINIVPFGNADFSFLDVWFPSDNSYEPGKAYHYIAGMETQLPFAISFDTEIYYKQMNHLFEFNPNTNEVMSGKDLFFAGEGFAYGIDLYLEKKVGEFSGWISYFLGKTRRKFPDINKGKEYYPKYDRRNSISIVGIYKINKRWSANFAWTYGTGQAFTQAVGHYQMQYLNRNIWYVIGEDKNTSRLPAYHRMDIGVRYERKVSKFNLNKWSFYLQIFNLYNRRNIWFRNVDFTEDMTPEVLEVKMLPLVPTFGLELYF